MLVSESMDSDMRQWMDAQTYMVVMNEWMATEITIIIYMRIWRNVGLDKHHSCSYLNSRSYRFSTLTYYLCFQFFCLEPPKTRHCKETNSTVLTGIIHTFNPFS